MPVLDIDLEKIGNTLCNIKATMLYPENPVERRTYFTLYQNASQPKRDRQRNVLTTDADVLRHLRSFIEMDVQMRQEQGIITGGLLVLIKQLSDYGAEASVNKAIHIMGQWGREEGIVKHIKTGRTKLQQYWSRFKPVAHLWADVYLRKCHMILCYFELVGFAAMGDPVDQVAAGKAPLAADAHGRDFTLAGQLVDCPR